MHLYRAFIKFLGLLAGLVFGLQALAIGIDVIARNLGWFNLPWVLEVSEYVLYGATFLAAPWVLSENAHVRVDVLVSQLPIALNRYLDVLINGIGVLVSAILVYFGALASWDAYRLGSLIFKELILPEWWLLLIMPIAGLLLTVEFICRLKLRPPGNVNPSDTQLREN